MNFAQTLKILRKRKRLSQDDLGKALGTTKSAICKYEKAGIYPTCEGLCALADYFHVTTDQLLGREPLPKTDERKEGESVDKNSAIKFRHGFYTDQEIEIAEKLVETLRQFPINYSSATSILDLANKLLGEAVTINLGI